MKTFQIWLNEQLITPQDLKTLAKAAEDDQKAADAAAKKAVAATPMGSKFAKTVNSLKNIPRDVAVRLQTMFSPTAQTVPVGTSGQTTTFPKMPVKK